MLFSVAICFGNDGQGRLSQRLFWLGIQSAIPLWYLPDGRGDHLHRGSILLYLTMYYEPVQIKIDCV